MDATSLFQLLSWNMDGLSAACANLKFLSRMQDPGKVRILRLWEIMNDRIKIFHRDSMLVIFMIRTVFHVDQRSIIASRLSWKVYSKIQSGSML